MKIKHKLEVARMQQDLDEPFIPPKYEEPHPYYNAYPTIEIWAMTFWEHARRQSGQVPKDRQRMFGVEKEWWSFIPDNKQAYALDCIWAVLEPGSREDFRFYRMCLRKAYLRGYIAWEIKRGMMGHRRAKNIFASARMKYPEALDRVTKWSEKEYLQNRGTSRMDQPDNWVESVLLNGEAR